MYRHSLLGFSVVIAAASRIRNPSALPSVLSLAHSDSIESLPNASTIPLKMSDSIHNGYGSPEEETTTTTTSTTTLTEEESLSPAPPELKEAALKAQNSLRYVHDSPLLQWCDKCYQYAKKQANACQKAGRLFPGNLGWDNDEGQNLYYASSGEASDTYEKSVEEAVSSWYSQAIKFKYGVGRIQRGTGEFSQLIWKATTSMGMAVSDDGKFIVANYHPKGNVWGNFSENVGPVNPARLTEESSVRQY
mmetsp:Transcript_94117/g.147140  ORF Transcript_94117/g.147140 Transcript_94117/m.147140 type:complete len:248 (-) Transcript_94117:2-745(-)|eukprot:CAMPEP_0169410588 /NCGR_PEP_ID=MMETSP1017-20121227/59855_1 /TAXON_ID=342587 /ORGANISM="Karlodinium micrum, Strain CCMP2283" /LENGTH=247 /DNA_ID=CAMNT_0009517851 /DNA_START=46 /DNA_END=789 /DNA_ORIENTATION=+